MVLPKMALDRARIRLLLRNLMDNALKHGTSAVREVQPPEISLQVLDAAQVRLIIRDFGSGVAEADLDKLAEPFYRTDASRDRASGGVGLGLYLARLVAQAHGATWSIRNAHPGLEVSIVFPGSVSPH